MKEPIWITGAGIVSAVGCNKREVLESLVAGRSGIGPMRYLRSVHIEFPVGEVPMSDEELCAALGIDASTPTIRTALLGMLALGEALDEALVDDLVEELHLVGAALHDGGDDIFHHRHYLLFEQALQLSKSHLLQELELLFSLQIFAFLLFYQQLL